MKLLRSAVLALGFGVLGLLGLIEYVLSRRNGPARPPVEDLDADYVTATSVPLPSPTVARLRVALGALGVAIAAFGGYVVLRDVAYSSYLGLAVWMIAAIILHDAVLVPALIVLRAGARRAARRLPAAAFGLVEAGFIVGGVITLIAVPAIYAKHLGTLNPTVLPGAYGQALLVTWLVVAVVTAVAVAAVSLRHRRLVLAGVKLSH